MSPDASYEVSPSSDVEPDGALLVGLSAPGMAGLTAVDHLVRQTDSTELGHVSPERLPVVTPVEDGRPRAATRLNSLEGADLTVLVGEQFVPAWAAAAFVEAVLAWAEDTPIDEVAVLNGVQYPHEATDHRVFSVATGEYRKRNLEDTELSPLEGGVLGGVPAELVHRSLSGDAPPVGVYVTPVHPPGLDVDASLYLLDAVDSVYGVSVDLTALEDLSDRLRRHYATLSERLETLEESEDSVENRDFAVDRMYM